MSVAAHDAVATVAAAVQPTKNFRKKSFKLKLGKVKKFCKTFLSCL
jgi:hypothetical protein